MERVDEEKDGGRKAASSTTSSSPNLSLSKDSLKGPIPSSSSLQNLRSGDEARWKKYSLAVERSLLAFDQIEEWADSHAALARLLKTLQTWPHFTQVPKKDGVAQALAQSLDPALPAGIHARALEVYAHIFETIGQQGLEADLALYTLGLLPFVQHASTAVKPLLLNLLGKYLLDLDSKVLTTALRPLILALLSGMEEDTSDFFEPILELLDRLRTLLGDSLVFEQIWSIILTCPFYRGAAFSVVARRLPVSRSWEDIEKCSGGKPLLYIKALALALQDDQILVKRAALELLLTNWKLDSSVFQHFEQGPCSDLVNAAISVLLSRDMSLNRRLFAWLLGKSETSEEQINYFEQYALGHLKVAILGNLRTSDFGQAQIIFKILVSLLDKYEVGASLTSALVWDILKLLKNDREVLIPAAVNYFEALDPFLLWQQVAQKLLDSEDDKIIGPIRLLLQLLQIKDVETSQVHLPACLLLVLGKENSHFYLELINDFLDGIDPIIYAAQDEGPVWDRRRSQEFYAAGGDGQERSTQGLQGPAIYSSILQTFLSLGRHALLDSESKAIAYCRLILRFLKPCPIGLEVTQVLTKNVEDYIERAFASTQLARTHFDYFEVVLDSFFTCLGARLLDQGIIYKREVRQFCIQNSLFYLSGSDSQYHHAASRLLSLCVIHFGALTVQENLLKSMHSQELKDILPALEAFTTIWRTNEDEEHFNIPVERCLDAMIGFLHTPNLACRRRAETWLRIGIKSYNKILQPILISILECLPKPFDDSWSESADLGLLNHHLETCLALVRYGGQALMKAAKTSTSFVRQPSDPLSTSDASSLDTLVQICHQSIELDDQTDEYAIGLTLQIHLSALDIMQIVLTRGDLSHDQVYDSRVLLQRRLLRMIDQAELDLQNKILHVLHLSISIGFGRLRSNPHSQNTSQIFRSNHGTPQMASKATMSPTSPSNGTFPESAYSHGGVDDLTSLFRKAMTSRSNRPILQNWLDCLSMLLPHLKTSLCRAIIPLAQALSTEFVSELSNLEARQADREVTFVEQDFFALVNALERLVVFALQEDTTEDNLEDRAPSADRVDNTAGLIVYVSNIFTGDITNSSHIEDTILNTKLSCLRDSVRVCLKTLIKISRWGPQISYDMKPDQYKNALTLQIRKRLLKTIERFHKLEPQCVYEGLIESWNEEQLDASANAELFNILQLLATNSQTVLAIIFDAIRARLYPMSVRRPRGLTGITARVLMKFLEIYIQQLEGPIALLIWNDAIAFFRDLINSTSLPRNLHFPLLRSLHPLCCKVGMTAAADDRKIKKDIQEIYPRYVDISVAISGRSSATSNWIRRGVQTTTESSLDNQEKSSEAQDGFDQKLENDALIAYCSQHLVPECRTILGDQDKAIALCNSIMHYIVTPHIRANLRKETEPELGIYDLFTTMCQSVGLSKAWKPLALEAFYDPHFFQMTLIISAKWRTAVELMLQHDRSILPELLVRASATGTIFTSREQESLNRSYSIRRLGYVLLSGQSNSQLPQLLALQEKVIELIKTPLAANVTVEVYQLLRVMLLRFSPHHLQRLWPLIIADLLKMLKVFAVSENGTQNDLAALAGSVGFTPMAMLSAFKFINLAMILQNEDFQSQQWIVSNLQLPQSSEENGIINKESNGSGVRSMIEVEKVTSFEELIPILARLKVLSVESVNSVEMTENNAIERWVESDLLE